MHGLFITRAELASLNGGWWVNNIVSYYSSNFLNTQFTFFFPIIDALNLANNWVPIFIFYFSRLLVLCLTCWMLTNHIHDAATTSILHFRCTLFETYLLHVRKVNCIRLCYYWLIPNLNKLFLLVFYRKPEKKKYLTNRACFFKLT